MLHRVLHRFRRLSLDVKLIASYLVILGVGGLAISVVGSWIVSTAIRHEAQRTAAHDLALARATLGPELADRLRGGAPLATPVALPPVWRRLFRREGDHGVVAVFAGDVLVASSRDPLGASAVPMRAAPELAAAVLARGEPWQGRTTLGGERHLAAAEPLRDGSGAVVGMLYAGVREARYAAARNRVIGSFFAIATVGFALVIALTYRLIHSLTRPLHEMVAATRSVAAGRFDHPVSVGSEGDIGLLAESINTMQASLRQMRSELEESARTLEDKVRARTAELSRMQARTAQSERLAAIGVLAAGVAHEINNPLGAIFALSALALEDTAAADPRRENLEEVVRQTRRCGEIVRHLLEFSRQHRVSPELVDAGALLERTLALLERQAIFHNIRVVRALDPALPRILAEAPQLQQVFVNVLVNAVQAMSERGTLTLGSRYDAEADQVVLTFQDTGCGIPPDQLDRVFDPFFTTKESGQGTGLGLSIAYGIVARHQGSIGVESEPGRGTTFTIRLPTEARFDEPPPVEDEPQGTLVATAGSPA